MTELPDILNFGQPDGMNQSPMSQKGKKPLKTSKVLPENLQTEQNSNGIRKD